MDVVSISSDLYRIAFKLITDSTQIFMKVCFDRWMNEWLSVFGTEYDVDVVLN